MTKETMDFIYALKKPMIAEDTDEDRFSLKEIAIEYLSQWSGSDKESYTEENLFSIVLRYFLDYIDSADKPSVCVRAFWEIKQRHDNYKLIMKKDDGMTDVDFMLSTLQLVRVKNGNKYVNGFKPQGGY